MSSNYFTEHSSIFQAPIDAVGSAWDFEDGPKLQVTALTANQIDIIDTLSSNSFLAGLPLNVLAEIADCCQARKYETGDYVFSEGQDATACYIVASGRIGILKQTSELERMHSLLPSGHAFAILPTIEKKQYTVSARSECPSELYVLSRRDALRLVKRFPEIRSVALSIIGQRMNQALEFSSSISSDSPRVRIASVLLALGPLNRSRNTYSIALEIAELAKICCLKTSVVGKICRKLEEGKFICLQEPGKILVLDREALAEFTPGPFDVSKTSQT